MIYSTAVSILSKHFEGELGLSIVSPRGFHYPVLLAIELISPVENYRAANPYFFYRHRPGSRMSRKTEGDVSLESNTNLLDWDRKL